jgi:aryl-alcohol dehydrogenase-like predicted oxidoreductase
MFVISVRLGKSGLKVSRIILGCATYGSSEYWDWVLGEEEGIAHIKAAYDAGINTFDTSDVRTRFRSTALRV